MSKKKAELLYDQILKQVTDEIGHNSTTYSSELNKVCKKHIGSKFKGVISRDQLNDDIISDGETIIVNMDDSDKPGSHWCGVYCENNKCLFYDSFGRSNTKNIIGAGISKKKYNTELDVEQHENEDNCGQRSCAFCIIADKHGWNMAKHL